MIPATAGVLRPSTAMAGARWEPAESDRATLAITAHWWRTRWLGGAAAA
jgi:hypothetical protein